MEQFKHHVVPGEHIGGILKRQLEGAFIKRCEACAYHKHTKSLGAHCTMQNAPLLSVYSMLREREDCCQYIHKDFYKKCKKCGYYSVDGMEKFAACACFMKFVSLLNTDIPCKRFATIEEVRLLEKTW